ncbi:glycogen synthase [Thiospirochaeta perfilievii]|uniref:starch synthase n=1 Tax=Thiospirochaeta perfilievii TaxID=252967 RepID=A0A5C1QES6_9SPIO|nr:glycogen/starch synthase [Thiospirochaeta perfilievii]QEN05888.1 glycogen synthase [Thiospirochaeta perfilievii]
MVVYQLSREFYPFANAGGLKEVVTGIGESLYLTGHSSSVFIPCYGFIDKSKYDEPDEFSISPGGIDTSIRVYKTEYNGIRVYLLEFSYLLDKNDVYTYTHLDEKNNPLFKRGHGFIDNPEINIIFQYAFLKYVELFLIKPDIILLHDGHTGLVPVMVKSNPILRKLFKYTKIFFIIHNAGIVYHQRFLSKILYKYRVVSKKLIAKGCFNGEIDPIFIAALYSNPLTVSPYYAEEILNLVHEDTSGNFGQFCNENSIKIYGITNGVDIKHFKKIGIEGLPNDYEKNMFKISVSESIGRIRNVKVWGNINFDKDTPLFLFQNRVTEQKGIDKFIDAYKSVEKKNIKAQFIVMGQGETKYENKLIELAEKYPKNFCYIQGYDEKSALSLFIASDYFILTSLWEPCGLTDFEAQLAGSIPIVHKTGGLKKVINGETGFVFEDFKDLEETIYKCVDMFYDDKETITLMQNRSYKNIEENYTWKMVLQNRYLPLFFK